MDPRICYIFSFILWLHILYNSRSPKLLVFVVCLIIRYRVKVLSLDLSRISAAYWPCDMVSLQKCKVLFPKNFTLHFCKITEIENRKFLPVEAIWDTKIKFEIFFAYEEQTSLFIKSCSNIPQILLLFGTDGPFLFAVVIFTALKAFFYYGFGRSSYLSRCEDINGL